MSESLQDVQDNVTAFQRGTLALALHEGYPVVSPEGTFIHDARAGWLISAVESWHVAQQKPRSDPGWFHASSLGRSDEELVAAFLGQGHEDHDARRLRIFDLGHDRDASWKRYLAGAGIAWQDKKKHREMRLNWLRLCGECDEIVTDPEGRLCLVEIKTKAQYLFSKLHEPDEAHRLQVNAYMGGMGISQAIVLYEAKNDQQIKVFYEPFSTAVWEGIVSRLLRLRREAEARLST